MKILYVGGYTRSGSTLVGRVLGEPPNTVCVGETHYLWSRGLIDNVGCGCGRPFRSCPFWSAVGDEAFGGWNRGRRRVAHRGRSCHKSIGCTALLLGTLVDPVRDKISDYATRLAALYAAIARVSGAKR